MIHLHSRPCATQWAGHIAQQQQPSVLQVSKGKTPLGLMPKDRYAEKKKSRDRDHHRVSR